MSMSEYVQIIARINHKITGVMYVYAFIVYVLYTVMHFTYNGFTVFMFTFMFFGGLTAGICFLSIFMRHRRLVQINICLQIMIILNELAYGLVNRNLQYLNIVIAVFLILFLRWRLQVHKTHNLVFSKDDDHA